MGNREVSVSICGVVVGVILGAGAVSFAQDVSMSASILKQPTDLVLNRGEVLRRSTASAQPPDRSKLPTIKDATEPTNTATVTTPPTICGSVKDVVKEIGAAHDRLIAKTQDNTELIVNLNMVLDSVVTKYCSAEKAAAAQTSSASSGTVKKLTIDNKCIKYGLNTTRYTQCKIYESLGRSYKGW